MSLRLRRAGLALGLLFSACSNGEPSILALAEAGSLEALFAIELDEAGAASSFSPPMSLEGDARLTAQTFQLSSEREAWLLGYREEDLLGVSRLYQSDREDELELIQGRREDCPQGAIRSVERRLELAVPRPGLAWRADGRSLISTPPESATFLEHGALSLLMPIDPEACLEPTHRALRPYGAEAVPIPVGTVLEGTPQTINQLAPTRAIRLPDERLLLQTPFWLFLIEPGRPFTPAPGNYLRIAPSTVVLATDIRSGTNPERVRIVGVNDYGGDEGVTPVWQEIELGPEGLRMVEVIEIPEFLQDVIFDPDTGWFIAAGEFGSIVVRRDVQSPLDWKPSRFTTEDGRAILGRTGWPEQPYVVTGGERAQVLVGSPSLDRWELLPAMGLDASGRLRSLVVAPLADGPRIYVGTHNAELYWYDRPRAEWHRHRFRLPSNYECGVDDGCGSTFQIQALRDLLHVRRNGADHLYATMNDCMAVLDIRLDEECAGVLPMPGRADLRPPTISTAGGTFLLNVRGIHISESGMLTVASQEGGVYEMAVGDSAMEPD